MYVTKAEREYARSLAFLRLAQQGLASARLMGDAVTIKDHEANVLRMLRYAANAQDWVIRQRKRNPGRMFQWIMDIPYTLDVAA